MLADYRMLKLTADATDEQIRIRYLERVKKHPPEQDPNGFQDVTLAYERIRNRRTRVANRLFGCMNVGDVDEALAYLARALQPDRKRAGLKALLRSVQG